MLFVLEGHNYEPFLSRETQDTKADGEQSY